MSAMANDELVDDIQCTLGTYTVPPFLEVLAEKDSDLFTNAWRYGKNWLDSDFFEEAAVVAGAAVEEVADNLPPDDDHVLRGALGGSDLPALDAALEGLVQSTPRALLLVRAWRRAVTEEGFGEKSRIRARPLCPGPPAFLRDLPRPPADGPELAAELAAGAGIEAGAGHLVPLTPWPDYLRVAIADLTTKVATPEHADAIERIARQTDEIVAGLCPPIAELEGADGPGAEAMAAAADLYPALVVATAFLRLGVPAVARIPRVA